ARRVVNRAAPAFRLSHRRSLALALGHDGLWVFANRILADWILADWSLANRRAGGGGSLRGRSAAAAALSTVNNPTGLNTAMNPAVLTTARNAVVTRIMIFITLSPFVETLGERPRDAPICPAVERLPPLY